MKQDIEIKNVPQLPGHNMFKTMSENLEAQLDPLGLLLPIFNASMTWALHPAQLAEHTLKMSERTWAICEHWWRRTTNTPSEAVVEAHGDDTRFSDPVWNDSPHWDFLKEMYLLWTRSIQDMLYATPGLPQKEQRRAAFWWRTWLNMMSPTNFLLTNPVAQRKALESNGESLLKGWKLFVEDLAHGNIRMTNYEDFTVGENLATTAGAVVYRNALLEVIHYTPTASQVHKVPVVLISPWINKYYILDLTPQKSLVRYLLEKGFDVFITSWKNPGAEMRNTTFEDYLFQGVGQIIQVAQEISGSKKVQAVGYCVGGTALAAYLAWANRKFKEADQVPVSRWTLFNTLVDFAKPGDIEVFIDQADVRWIGKLMQSNGYLDGGAMAGAFRLLRSNSLVWNFAVNSYLYGEPPRANDVLYWNMDNTRMPAAMHEFYLREMYLHNRLVQRDALTLAGQPIDLSRISQPLYTVSTVDDHIAPWRRTFRINFHVTAPRRFVRSSSGHILGIINPPVNPPKRSYKVADVQPHDNWQRWEAHAEEHQGSWWDDWVNWLREGAGALSAPPSLGTDKYPALAKAPGVYVKES